MRDIIRVPKEYTIKSIKNAYGQFIRRRERLSALDRAYDTGQVGPTTHAYTVNNCKTIADTKSSYIAGIPPTYSCAEGDDKGEAILDLYKQQVKQQMDQEITNLCSIYGLAFEVAYLEQEVDPETGGLTVTPKSVELSPMDGFVAYDETLDPDSVFGAIHYMEVDDNRVEHHYLDVYDAREYTRYKMDGANGGTWSEIPGTRRPHGFDRVPITEYRNNPRMRGDFEPILPLQLALNEVLSDRVKDKNRFANAMLVSKGFFLGDTQEEVDENMGQLKEDPYIGIPKDAELTYLTKQFDESSVQILVDYIDAQMHKVSGIPDMTDEQFAANASGVAIKYKLMALNNLAQSFIAQFNRGFLRRCKLYSYALFGSDGAQVEDMRVTFKFNLPADNSYDAQTMQIYAAAGALSRKTMMENCPYIDDVDQEEERLAEEATTDSERDMAAFEDRKYTDIDVLGEESEEEVPEA